MSKPPAFQFYAAEYLADENVALMTLEEEGAYIRAMSYCWREGSLPSDDVRLSRLLKGCTPEALTTVKGCFRISSNDPSRLIHLRLDAERKKQTEWKRKSSEAGKKSGKVRRAKKFYTEPTFNQPSDVGCDLVEPKTNSSFASSSSMSLSLTETETKTKTSNGHFSSPAAGSSPRNGKAPSAMAPPIVWPGQEDAPNGNKSSTSFHDQAEFIATAVIDGIGVTTRWGREQIVKQAEHKLRTSATTDQPFTKDELRDGMILQWKRFRECVRQDKILPTMKTMSAEKFFGEGIWENSKDWGLKKGMSVDGIAV
jgi:uncharacterized protein YdaU (DUF1376 family)